MDELVELSLRLEKIRQERRMASFGATEYARGLADGRADILDFVLGMCIDRIEALGKRDENG